MIALRYHFVYEARFDYSILESVWIINSSHSTDQFSKDHLNSITPVSKLALTSTKHNNVRIKGITGDEILNKM